jgi:hypothetical protein
MTSQYVFLFLAGLVSIGVVLGSFLPLWRWSQASDDEATRLKRRMIAVINLVIDLLIAYFVIRLLATNVLGLG